MSEVKIILEKPPIFEEVEKRFDLSGMKPIFAYDGKIYNPFRGIVDEHLVAHESVHFKQQEKVGGAENWWRMYLDDPKFRFEQEIPAYQAQYRSLCREVKNRNITFKYLMAISKDLSGPMYGNMISFNKAIKIIKG